MLQAKKWLKGAILPVQFPWKKQDYTTLMSDLVWHKFDNSIHDIFYERQ